MFKGNSIYLWNYICLVLMLWIAMDFAMDKIIDIFL